MIFGLFVLSLRLRLTANPPPSQREALVQSTFKQNAKLEFVEQFEFRYVGLRHASTGRKCSVFMGVFGEYDSSYTREGHAPPLQCITIISPTNRN